MTNDIIGKLARLLCDPIDSECKAVYLLAEVRKVLEKEDPRHTKPALRMYCHWALHVDRTRAETTRDLLERIDRWVTNTVAYLTPAGPWTFYEEHRLFKDFIYLSTFRQQLGEFLADHSLPVTLCTDDTGWNRFIESYAGVIEDGSLSIAGNRATLAAVDKVVFEKGASLTGDHHVPFVIQWTIHLKDGRTVNTLVESVPGTLGNMTAHQLEVVSNGYITPE